MPATVGGLAIAVALLIPGYVHLAVRRGLVPTRQLSAMMETAQLVAVAVAANAGALATFGLLRLLPPGRSHTPDVARLLRDPSLYMLRDNARVAYVLTWAAALLALSSVAAAAAARRAWPFEYVSKRFAPAIVDSSAWFDVFETQVPGDASVHVGCVTVDGSYIAGSLSWFSTAVEDTPDRDLVLAPPFTVVDTAGVEIDVGDVGRVVISARDIRRAHVSYVRAGVEDDAPAP